MARARKSPLASAAGDEPSAAAVKSVRLGSRGSPLARRQAELVRDALARAWPERSVELVFIRTSGDRLYRHPLASLGGKGLFVKEIEEALVAGRIDAAVHSMKDLPGIPHPALAVAAVPVRADPRDLLVAPGAGGLEALPRGLRVGTGSLRRRAQVRARRPDLEVVPLRGNVGTRLRRLREGAVDALVLAVAGLARLGIEEPLGRPLCPRSFIPAVGQGALALQCRAEDGEARALLAPLDHPPSGRAVAAERGFLEALGGDCRTPLAAHAWEEAGRLHVVGLVADPEGERVVSGEVEGEPEQARAAGERLARDLLARGAGAILVDVQRGC